jgi:hypothetical protein
MWFLIMRSTLAVKSFSISFFPCAFLFKVNVLALTVRLGWHLQKWRKARDTHASRAASRIGIRECIRDKMSCKHKYIWKKNQHWNCKIINN